MQLGDSDVKRRTWRFAGVAAALSCVVALAWWWTRPASSIVQVVDFGDNPTALEMHLYVPPRPALRPAVLLALHWCQGSGPELRARSRYAQLADELGFIVIFPSAVRPSRCWDVHSTEALTRGGASDSRGLLAMVEYVITRHGGDRQRVFVAGHSSGGMMTQVLLGAYPDVFRAGSASAGVPLGCFAGPDEWNRACALGRITRSAPEWGDSVRRAYAGYAGVRPRVQLWHGTADDALSFHNFGESLKQWGNVLGTGTRQPTVEDGVPGQGWKRLRFTDERGDVVLEGYEGANMPHDIEVPEREVLRFFGLDTSN